MFGVRFSDSCTLNCISHFKIEMPTLILLDFRYVLIRMFEGKWMPNRTKCYIKIRMHRIDLQRIIHSPHFVLVSHRHSSKCDIFFFFILNLDISLIFWYRVSYQKFFLYLSWVFFFLRTKVRLFSLIGVTW